jgi:hypothetical protein
MKAPSKLEFYSYVLAVRLYGKRPWSALALVLFKIWDWCLRRRVMAGWNTLPLNVQRELTQHGYMENLEK